MPIAAETTNPRFKKQLEDMAEVWERLAAHHRKRTKFSLSLIKRSSSAAGGRVRAAKLTTVW